MLPILWHILHFVISTWYCAQYIAHVIESYFISSGLMKRYKSLNLDRLQYLAVVVDSEEVHQTSKVIELLHWLSAIGVKNVCLYDAEGKGALVKLSNVGSFFFMYLVTAKIPATFYPCPWIFYFFILSF